MNTQEFITFQKIPRLTRICTITEKINGTNAQIYIADDDTFNVGSRNKWITPDNDNAGFARWAYEHEQELRKLGYGRHFGEWWGNGIQVGYGQQSKRFSLFNTSIWSDPTIRPTCCDVVPVLYEGIFSDEAVENAMALLREKGSIAAPGFMKPEGIIIYHHAADHYFKKTLDKDEEWKSKSV